jgi:paraquat-inducible protein B
MSKQANKKAIGAFVVVALALAVAAIVVFGSGKFFVKSEQYVAFFQGSVKGLRVGAPVVFRGVKIGEVTKIMIYADRHDRSFEIPVILEIEPENFQSIGPEAMDRKQYVQELIKSGLRAQLQMQSMVTGQLMINIDFFPDTPVRLVGSRKIALAKGMTEIPTIQTSMQKIEKTLQDIPIGEIANSINKSLNAIEALVTSEELTKSLHYFKQTAKDIRDLARHVDEKIDPLSADLGQTLKDAQRLIGNVDNQVEPLASSFKRTSDTAGAAFTDVRKLTKNINGQVKTLAGDLANTLQKAAEALSTVRGMIEEGSPLRFQVETTFSELAQAARSIRTLANFLERNPDALLRGKSETGGY